ncbi:hypothetical protein HHK36_028702 [Tetracentron sinense]|uniref:Uncharacterized protein n=1 Tax=Tetracentron sinense TaxID=13715 RepID=A0A834YGR1_TETSI|nr:hypothetical protein HHK36_028702 [Tetracentron sinense]
MTDPDLELQESGWEELRKEARKIEGDLDVKLSSYAKLGARLFSTLHSDCYNVIVIITIESFALALDLEN